MKGLKISAVVPTWNEEPDELQATLDSLRQSVTEVSLQLVVVDDGSDVPVELEGDDVLLIRHDKPRGVGQSRNEGASGASGDVLTFHDPHMRFAQDSIEYLAAKALSEPCVASLASNDYRTGRSFIGWGADLYWNSRNGLEPKYDTKKPKEEWHRVPCMMGAAYAISRDTLKELKGPTGNLWDDVAGRWGKSEEFLSVKAFLLDIPVLVSRDVKAGHKFRKLNPVPGAAREVWKNMVSCACALFTPRTFRERFRPFCRAHMFDREIDEIIEQHRRPWHFSYEEEARVFTHLLGKGVDFSGPHLDNRWLDEVKKVLKEKHPARILVWRPGEVVPLCRRILPEADIKAIEIPGHRANNWWDACREMDVELHKVPLGEEYALRPLRVNWDKFDLILIGGEMQEECMKTAKGVLAIGGTIIRNETKDFELVIGEVMREEEAYLRDRPSGGCGSVVSHDKWNDLRLKGNPGSWGGLKLRPAAIASKITGRRDTSGMPRAFFGPWIGEYGHEIGRWQMGVRKFARELKATHCVIVMSEVGHETLYEEADEFWWSPDIVGEQGFTRVCDHVKVRDEDEAKRVKELLASVAKGIAEKLVHWDNADLLMPMKKYEEKTHEVKLIEPRSPQSLRLMEEFPPHFCFLPRLRKWGNYKNWAKRKWRELIGKCEKETGLRALALGTPFEVGAFDGPGVDLMTNFDLAVAALRTSVFAVCSEGGGIFLSLFCGTPTVSFGSEKWTERITEIENPLRTPVIYLGRGDRKHSVEEVFDAIRNSGFAERNR